MREMKNSGVEWIGDIPSDWQVLRTKNFYSHHKDVVGDEVDNYERLALTLGGVIKRPKEDSTGLQPEAFGGYQILRKNELVFKLIDLENVSTSRVGYSPYTGIVSPAYIVLKPFVEAESKFGEYYFLSMWQREIFNHMGDDGVRSSLNSKDLLNIPYISCPIEEKKKIVAFLDGKCAEIDTVIEKTKATIEEYKKLKQSVITQAVTKGIRPNRPMKDSGIEWIGEIPADWDKSKIKNIVLSLESGVSVNAADIPVENSTQFGVLKTSSVSKFLFVPSEHKQVNIEEYERVSCPVRKNTIIVSRMNTPELVGACGYVDDDYPNLFLPDRLWQITLSESIVTKFVWYYLINQKVRSYISSLSSGTSSSMQNISKPQFDSIILLLPNKGEQQEIVNYLDKKCSEIDELIAKKTSLLSELESYKKSLIYEYVTGKKEV